MADRRDQAGGGETAQAADLLLGVDGGGTRTRAALARCDAEGASHILGRGEAGPGNPQQIGRDEACRNILLAVERAYVDAGLPWAPAAAACLGLAGTGREPLRDQMRAWGMERRLATRVHVVHDAELILAAGTRERHGLALIAGTGSFCFGRNEAGETGRTGGWGPLLGDEGSGYWIAVSALRAVAREADRRGPPTSLATLLLPPLGVTSASGLIGAISVCVSDPTHRCKLADLAPIVLQAAEEGDPVADAIRAEAADELAKLVSVLGRRLRCQGGHYELAVAGGVLVHHQWLRNALFDRLVAEDFAPHTLSIVPDPVRGALRLAQEPI